MFLINPYRYAVADTWTANNATISAQDGSLSTYWKMEDLADSVGTSTFTNVGSATFTSGKNNNAVSLNGSTQYLTTTSNSGLGFGTGDFTISQWVNADSLGDTTNAGMKVFARFANGADGSRLVYGFKGSYFYALNPAGSERPFGSPGVAHGLSTGSWNHFVLVRNSTVLYLYINGSLVDSGAFNVDISSTGLAYIGYYNGSYGKLDGQMDELCIWKGYGADLTFVQALYNSGTGSFYV
jgi:hypothetical protein